MVNLEKNLMKMKRKTLSYNLFSTSCEGKNSLKFDEAENVKLGKSIEPQTGFVEVKKEDGLAFEIGDSLDEIRTFFVFKNAENGYAIGYATDTFLTVDFDTGIISPIDFCGAKDGKIERFINAEDKEFYLVSGENGIAKIDVENYSVGVLTETDNPYFCVSGYRLVCFKDGYLCFSAPMDDEDLGIEEFSTGRISLSDYGNEVVGLEEYGGKIFVFFEDGICAVTAKGAINEFVVERVDFSGNRIEKGSVAKDENGIYFATEHKILRLCGGVETVVEPIGFYPEAVFSAVAFDGKYYLKFSEDFEKKLLVVDLTKKDYHVENDRFVAVSRFDGRTYGLYATGKVLCFDKLGETDASLSFETELNTTKKKFLKSVRFEGKGVLHVKVENGYECHWNTLRLDGKINCVCPVFKGKKFRLTMLPQTKSSITKITFEYAVYGE